METYYNEKEKWRGKVGARRNFPLRVNLQVNEKSYSRILVEFTELRMIHKKKGKMMGQKIKK